MSIHEGSSHAKCTQCSDNLPCGAEESKIKTIINGNPLPFCSIACQKLHEENRKQCALIEH